MKSLLRFIAILFIPLTSFAGARDTIVQGVHVESGYSVSIFPETWQGGSVNAEGEQISDPEMRRAQPITIRALKKYPTDLLQYNLRAVYLLKSMKFFNVGYGGTNSSDAVYVTSNGVSLGYTDAYIEQTIHHEFSSILYRNYIRFFDSTEWKKANDPGFDYNDPENGVGAIRNGRSSQALDTALAKFGLITEYAMSGIENDVNTLAQNLFLPDRNFWKIVDSYPRVYRKVRLLIGFYNKITAQFTEQYFRSLSNN
jgi:hypothetical protein